MKIDIQLVKDIAVLSRIKITDQEAAKFEIEFREMFEYFAKIQEIHDSSTNTKKTESKLRNDEVKGSTKEDSNRIIDNFNQKEGRIMIAPKTL
ncbi:MAG: Asp-tRNA(Asn)/Glu-tRNA(Gln) amidotransferase subunit GatC [Candidatus Bilamarchaeum sp.]|jgi:aspartyl/glutamyl-tRNA(Asn/Gln) amidotransferase C subunit